VLLVDTNYSHVAEARMQGLPAQCANILSEFVEEEMDLAGIGRLLAVTPNEEVNALAVREMAHVFGRRNVYQISPDGTGSGRRSVGDRMRGRLLFRKELGSAQFARLLMEGSVIKKTKLGDEFDYSDFQQMYGHSAVILFVIDTNKNLRVCTADETISPQAGETLLALVPEEP
jgi:hypothetical protein